MKMKLAAVLVVLAALLAACTGGGETTNNQPPEDAAPDTATAAPEESAEEPGEAPGDDDGATEDTEPTEPAVSIGTPGLDMGDDGDDAPDVPIPVAVAQQVLAQQVNVTPDQITIVDYEEVEWENTCLGLNLEAELCEDQVIPGYRVVLEADGDEYEIHTDDQGQRVALASAPEVSLENVSVTWESTEPPCQVAALGPEGVVYGLCDGPALMDPFVDQDRAEQLAGFVSTYQGFEAETPAGTVTFEGEGDTEATEAEERMIAEWARLTAVESSSGRRAVELGLAILLHQEGGEEQVCQDVLIYATGTARAYSCNAEMPEELGEVQLSAGELEDLYTWLDSLQQFTIDETALTDQPTPGADATAEPPAEGEPVRQMIFAGRGEEQVTEEQNDEILAFALDQLDAILASGPPADDAEEDAEPTPTDES